MAGIDFEPVCVPTISVSPPPVEAPIGKPLSPFTWPASPLAEDDSCRPHLLSPPVLSTCKRPSPLRPNPRGLERERFEALLNATRERSASANKMPDLRMEVARRVHRMKQAERRALFLSKVSAPPSPTATGLPKTPPESPAILHYSLPSPGLQSPLTLFEMLNNNSIHLPGDDIPITRESWVEQVDFRFPQEKQKVHPPAVPSCGKPSRGTLPTLDEITARIGSRGKQLPIENRSNRLPAFLSRPPVISKAVPSSEWPRLRSNVGRLQMPQRRTDPIPRQSTPPMQPMIQITTTRELNSRQRSAKMMLTTLRRRSLPDPPTNPMEYTLDAKWKRRSAPAEMMVRPRGGFQHSVLSMPGGF
ncbi:hypothetical protein FISHEDRAFT_49329 [Fistulina hepatica ATCC 64428]|uniref:Uncharacterized protein n=1 Tax=Fistulina hepatica ATCC 64428 TaxID=1128425 RepID=A0A0D7A4Q9_9AGAR|nr:hypothetical protein FISHEDRAFT_49329 [Fistulina hepatica ATCC 64428]